jgi:hypothetical protein
MIGSRCSRDRISPETGATVLSHAPESLNADPMMVIDAELKQVTDRILEMIGGLSA